MTKGAKVILKALQSGLPEVPVEVLSSIAERCHLVISGIEQGRHGKLPPFTDYEVTLDVDATTISIEIVLLNHDTPVAKIPVGRVTNKSAEARLNRKARRLH